MTPTTTYKNPGRLGINRPSAIPLIEHEATLAFALTFDLSRICPPDTCHRRGNWGCSQSEEQCSTGIFQ